jgi:hypothetical protein
MSCAQADHTTEAEVKGTAEARDVTLLAVALASILVRGGSHLPPQRGTQPVASTESRGTRWRSSCRTRDQGMKTA